MCRCTTAWRAWAVVRAKPERRTRASRRISSRLDEGLTGEELLPAGLLEHPLDLGLAQAVLGAQPLLLLEPDGVVGLGPPAGAAVLARAVRPLLEVLDRLGSQREAEGAREAHLTARAGHCHAEFLFLSW